MGATGLLLRRFSLRHWRRAPGQNALLVLILSLGVGVFIAIRLANRAAIASFRNFTDTLVGPSDWVIEAPVGPLPESVLGELRSGLGGKAVEIIPVLEATAAAPVRGVGLYETPTYTLVGLDLIGVLNLEAARGAAAPQALRGGFDRFWADFQDGPRVWVPPALSAERSLRVAIDDRVAELPVAGVIAGKPGGEPPPKNLLIMDLPRLQALTGRIGRLDRVEFVVDPGPDLDRRRAELGAWLTRLGGNGRRWTVRTPGARRQVAEEMTAAFRLNLTVLSLIALLVGLYLIVQALDGAVVRRRSEIAILRSLGVDAAAIRRLWLLESAVLGLIGGAGGVAAGWLGAQAAVRAVGRTVNTLYYATTVSRAGLAPGEIWLGLGLGMAASVAAGWWPAREAAETPPTQILGRGAAPGAGIWRRPWYGLAALVGGWALTRVGPLRLEGGTRFPLAGYGAALLWIVGGGVLFAGALPLAARAARALGRCGPAARVAMGHLGRPSGRHALAVASLLSAVGMSAGMAILVASFERTVRSWIGHELQADLYVYSAGARSASASDRIPAATWESLARHPGVASAAVLAAYPIHLGPGAPAQLEGTNLETVHRLADLPWLKQPRGDALFDPRRDARLAAVSESFADRFRKGVGDRVVLPTPAGPRAVTIAGVYADYGSDQGTILVPWHSLVAWMGDASATHVSLFVRPGVNPDALGAAIEHAYPGLRVLTRSRLRALVLRVFRQTFGITYALEAVGLVVAIAGLALALASVLLDRREELTTLRALGFSRPELAAASSWEGLALAGWGAAGGLVLSLALGWLLVHVINKQSFGWTLQVDLPGGRLALLAGAVALTGAGVSFVVGLWGADLPADREE